MADNSEQPKAPETVKPIIMAACLTLRRMPSGTLQAMCGEVAIAGASSVQVQCDRNGSYAILCFPLEGVRLDTEQTDNIKLN
jgi:hypothetical protein